MAIENCLKKRLIRMIIDRKLFYKIHCALTVHGVLKKGTYGKRNRASDTRSRNPLVSESPSESISSARGTPMHNYSGILGAIGTDNASGWPLKTVPLYPEGKNNG